MTNHNQHISGKQIVSHSQMLWEDTIQRNIHNKMTVDHLLASLRGCGGVKWCKTTQASKLQHKTECIIQICIQS